VAWDRAWHASRPFEDFWSPPHLFLYAMHALATLTVARLLCWREGHAAFGHPVRLRPLPVRLPGPLLILAGGLLIVSLGGLLDGLWHSRFGLDETGWSLPHALLGWGILLGLYGLVAARLALARLRPLAWYARLLTGLVVLGATLGILLGPLEGNATPELVRRVAALPVLAGEPAFQHTARIYLEADLTRLGPLFAPAAALAGGTALALTRRLLPGPWWLLGVSALFTWLSLSGGLRTARFFDLHPDPRTWLPLPVLPAAGALVGGRAAGLGEGASWAVAGALFGGATILVWGQPAPLLVPATAAFVAGAVFGRRLARWLIRPTGPRVAALTLLGLAVPVALGLVDLSLRARIP
jgi:hypothetical protein